MVAERVEDPVSELSVGHRASDLGLLVATVHFRKGGAAAFPCLPGLPGLPCYTCLLMSGAPAGLAEGLEDLLAAAGVQAAGGGGGGQAVRVPVVGELLPQS